jgi:tetratricopeptide (TPR) repeat protein
MSGMATLRIDQLPGTKPGHHQVTMTFGSAEQPPQSASVGFPFALSAQEREDIRWYLEDYLDLDEEPAPKIAARVERRMAELGEALFRAIFLGSHEARAFWSAVEPHLNDTRVEVTTGIAEATSIPWELLRDPGTGASIALVAQAFVRRQRTKQASQTMLRRTKASRTRILLVISRPEGRADVPFRSVAGRITAELGGHTAGSFEVNVLRPPTFQHLSETLQAAKASGEPYQAVHFDGHGTYADPAKLNGHVISGQSPEILQAAGLRGFLHFEEPRSQAAADAADPGRPVRPVFVDGFAMGRLLRESDVPVLLLNACQSAFAEPPAQPRSAPQGDARDEVEAYGSLAQAVLDSGVAGVVAMRYAIHVVTAAQFVAELYLGLARGRTLGEAAGSARKHLAENPQRQVALEPRPLRDWSVPVVWEQAPARIRPPASSDVGVGPRPSAGAQPEATDWRLPVRPKTGFFGRDETLYALDRAFDNRSVVLLHGMAGGGKTQAAAEFARWYIATGGAVGPVLFDSFQQHQTLASVLDRIGQAFPYARAEDGKPWSAITDPAGRRRTALSLLKKFPVLWIWDNVEPVAGFPFGSPSAWTPEEQRELRDFLEDAATRTRAKFLLTSRREERTWLGEIPTRVAVPPMPMREQLQLVHALAAHRGLSPRALPDLRPLLGFAKGNPLTIVVTVGQVLSEGIDTRERLEAYVAKLRAGAQEFAGDTEALDSRDRSLGASLRYGFEAAFSDEDQRALSLLHLFHGFVDIAVLVTMSTPDTQRTLESVRGLAWEQWTVLLDRAAEIGLLTAHGGGFYEVHAALPLFFREMFEQRYPGIEAERARRAFIGAMAQFGNYWVLQQQAGIGGSLNILEKEEDNLRAALALARGRKLWRDEIGVVTGLEALYRATGRRQAWRRLAEEVLPDLTDPVGKRPLAGREEAWGKANDIRIILAMEDQDWQEAERLQQINLDWVRERAAPALSVAPEKWDNDNRNRVRHLIASLSCQGDILRARMNGRCADPYEEGARLSRSLGWHREEATCVFNLGHAYKDIPALRDLDAAERCYHRVLEISAPNDSLTKAISLSQLGTIAITRFDDARAADQASAELLSYLKAATSYYRQALNLLPERAISDHAIVHNSLGRVYRRLGDVKNALHHFQQAIRYHDATGNRYSAGQARENAAIVLGDAGRMSDARIYAEAALANFREFGDRAAAEIQKVEALLAAIDAELYKLSSTLVSRGNVRLQGGDIHAGSSDVSEAVRSLQEVQDRLGAHFSPDSPANLAIALNSRGIARSSSGDIRSAISDYDEAIQLLTDLRNRFGADSPPSWEICLATVYMNRGQALSASGDTLGALSDYREAIRLHTGLRERLGETPHLSEEAELSDNDLAKVYTNRAGTLANAGDFNEAILDFSESIRLLTGLRDRLGADFPPASTNSLAVAYTGRGAARSLSGDARAAISDHSEAIQLLQDLQGILGADFLPPWEHGLSSALANRGNAWLRAGDWHSAIPDYEEAIQLLTGLRDRLGADFPPAWEIDLAANLINRANVWQSGAGTAREAIVAYDEAIQLTELVLKRLPQPSAKAVDLLLKARHNRALACTAIRDTDDAAASIAPGDHQSKDLQARRPSTSPPLETVENNQFETSSSSRVIEALQALTLSRNWDDIRNQFETYPELIEPESAAELERLIALLEKAGKAESVSHFRNMHRLLVSAQTLGVDQAINAATNTIENISPDLQALLSKIFGPEPPSERMPERIRLIEQALDLMDRDQHPEVWAGLQGVLGDSLRKTPEGDPAANIERALDAYKQASLFIPKTTQPTLWAINANNLARTYVQRAHGDPSRNFQDALAAFDSALSVLGDEKLPMHLDAESKAQLFELAGRSPEDLSATINRLQKMLTFLLDIT